MLFLIDVTRCPSRNRSIDRTLLLSFLYNLMTWTRSSDGLYLSRLLYSISSIQYVWWSSIRHIRLFHNVGGIKFISIRTVMILAWECAHNSDPAVPNWNQLPLC